MTYNLLVYQGKTTELLQEYSDLGIGGATVMTLVEDKVYPFSNSRIFFNNYFTSPHLIQRLVNFGIYCTGTIRASKIGNINYKLSKKEISKKPGGFIDNYKFEYGSMGLARWNNNSIVQVVSSAYEWKTNDSTVKR